MTPILVEDPEATLAEVSAGLSAGQQSRVCLRYSYCQYYLPDTPLVELLVLADVGPDGVVAVSLGHWSATAEQLCDESGAALELPQLAEKLGWPCFSLQSPLRLQPVAIPKPWGQEIWYTGIEARGQSQVSDGRFAVPLPWLLSLLPAALADGETQLNLLKILDPLPEEVFGDLYFELHEEKREVYVVTHVDERAWPTGSGGIRIGFSPEQRSRYPSDEAFVQAFGQAVKDYESVRRRIDALLDQCRLRDGVALNAPVSAEQTRLWLAEVPTALTAEEHRRRQVMDAFKATLPLQVGDVVRVPCYTPHSLLHGVRTIEFQTPVYERQILSFAQKVLTQDHWDTERALACMRLDDHHPEPLPPVHEAPSVRVEQVVEFADFEVWRVTLQAAGHYQLPLSGYALVIGVAGEIDLGGERLSGEQACLLPAVLIRKTLRNAGTATAVALVSFPRESL